MWRSGASPRSATPGDLLRAQIYSRTLEWIGLTRNEALTPSPTHARALPTASERPAPRLHVPTFTNEISTPALRARRSATPGDLLRAQIYSRTLEWIGFTRNKAWSPSPTHARALPTADGDATDRSRYAQNKKSIARPGDVYARAQHL